MAGRATNRGYQCAPVVSYKAFRDWPVSSSEYRQLLVLYCLQDLQLINVIHMVGKLMLIMNDCHSAISGSCVMC